MCIYNVCIYNMSMYTNIYIYKMCVSLNSFSGYIKECSQKLLPCG